MPGTTMRAQQGDTVDQMCQRFYGRTAGTTETVLEQNPGLANLGPVLPRGTKVFMPDLPPPAQKSTVQLWD